MVEKADNAHKLQMKAQKTAEDALNHLELFMAEQEKLVKQKTYLFFFLKQKIFFIGSTRCRPSNRTCSSPFCCC